MAKELPIVHKAFLATKNVESNFFLLTERAEKPDSDSFVFFIIETKKEKIGQAIQHQINLDLIKKFLSSYYFSLSQLEETLQTKIGRASCRERV